MGWGGSNIQSIGQGRREGEGEREKGERRRGEEVTAELRDLREGVSEPQAEDTASAKALRGVL